MIGETKCFEKLEGGYDVVFEAVTKKTGASGYD